MAWKYWFKFFINSHGQPVSKRLIETGYQLLGTNCKIFPSFFLAAMSCIIFIGIFIPGNWWETLLGLLSLLMSKSTALAFSSLWSKEQQFASKPWSFIGHYQGGKKPWNLRPQEHSVSSLVVLQPILPAGQPIGAVKKTNCPRKYTRNTYFWSGCSFSKQQQQQSVFCRILLQPVSIIRHATQPTACRQRLSDHQDN